LRYVFTIFTRPETRPDVLGLSTTFIPIIIHLPSHPYKNAFYPLVNAPLNPTTIPTPIF
jgi:hypothetical protein